MGSKYIKVDDVMELINTSNRGTCDYFIVDQIEELCKSEKIYDMNKVVGQLKEIKNSYDNSCIADAFQRGAYCGAKWMQKQAIKVVKGGGVDNG